MGSKGSKVRFWHGRCAGAVAGGDRFDGFHFRRPGGGEVMGVDRQLAGLDEILRRSGRRGSGISARSTYGERQLASVQKKYRLHPDIELQLKWMGPMEELPPNLGWVKPVTDYIPV